MSRTQTEMTYAALRKDAGSCDFQGLPDEELLDRFLGPDKAAAEDAFRELMRRHGPLVLGVCLQILGRMHDAEDAFQATFLTLARKAGAIRHRRSLNRWLYLVACRIAVHSRTVSARRRMLERDGAELSVVSPDPEHDPAWSELRAMLHREVNRLPKNYRGPVVLCYFEGRTNGEAATLLRWPEGTVKARLARARALLRARLTRRGLALDRA